MVSAELYRVFYFVGQYGNISKAAQKLYVSQPAVSKSIKKLEDLTGCPLFYRSSKGVQLTTEGEILFEYVQEGFQHLDAGEQILKKIQNKEAGVVRIGISTTLCKYILVPHLEQFHLQHPEIKINIINRTSRETLRLLEKGAVDFCIISLPEKKESLDFQPLSIITDIFVANPSYWPIEEELDFQRIGDFPLMMLEKGNVTRSYLDHFFLQQGVVLQPEIEISSMDFLIDFARIGIGIASVIKEFVATELETKSLQQIPLIKKIPPREIGIATQKKLPLSIAAQGFIDSLLVDD